MGKEFRYVGKPTPRIDGKAIVTGSAEYANDIHMHGMLYGRIKMSPHPHAMIKKIDVSRAIELPGVRTIMTYENAFDWITGMPAQKRLLDRHVRFIGDPVALIAATSNRIAEEAADLIEVEYEVLPAVHDLDEAIADGAPQLYEQFPNNIIERGCPPFGPKALQELVIGDTEKGFEECAVVVEGTSRYETISNPLPAESPGLVAWWDGPNQCSMKGSFQSPNIQKMIMQLAMPNVNVRVISANVGGSFGSKNTVPMEGLYCAALAKATGKPVKLIISKEAHLATYMLRLGSRLTAKVGLLPDGTVHAYEGTWLVGSGVHSDFGQGQIANGLGRAMLLLNKCKHWNYQPHLVATNRCRSGGIRGFGGQESYASLVPVLSMAMAKMNLDPVEFFKKNMCDINGGYYWVEGHWWENHFLSYNDVMDHAAEHFGWKDKFQGWLTPYKTEGSKQYGVGCCVHGSADCGMLHGEAFVKLDGWGTANINVCIAESGMGQRSSVVKMAAEILNLPLDKVTISTPDSQDNPWDWGLAGSRGTLVYGRMVGDAARNARTQLLEGAAAILHCSAEMLDTRDGIIFMKDNPEVALPWIAVLGPMNTITGHGVFEMDHSKPCFMIAFVEVEVDTDTGDVRIVRIVEGTDVGQVIDPYSLKMQLEGGLGSCGSDSAINEEMILDEKTGKFLTNNLVDFKWRVFPDLPTFETHIEETPNDLSAFGGIGVGEISGAPLPGAIMMAVSNAIGIQLMDYPLTPDQILKALGKAR